MRYITTARACLIKPVLLEATLTLGWVMKDNEHALCMPEQLQDKSEKACLQQKATDNPASDTLGPHQLQGDT